jgi:hypothetical protein
MAIEVHQSHPAFASAFCCATSLSAFYSATKAQQASSFLKRSFAMKGGVFVFSTTKHKPCHQCFCFSWFFGIFATWRFYFLQIKKHELLF